MLALETTIQPKRRRLRRRRAFCSLGRPRNSNGTPDECDVAEGTSPDCNANGVPDPCDVAGGSSEDCDSNGTPDECAPDCNSNAIADTCDVTFGTSPDCNRNGIPDECDCGLPIARILSAVTRKDHTNHLDEDIAISITGHVEDGNVTSEPRFRGLNDSPGAIKKLRITFDTTPAGPGSDPVTIWQQTGSPPGSQAAYVPYPGSQDVDASIAGNELILVFTPGLENARTYKIRINTSVTRVAGQTFEVRCLKADVNSSGRVNATDRDHVIAAWTGSGYSMQTDFNLNGATNAIDRNLVVNAWTDPGGHCAP